MTTQLCIYHGNCADGFGAAWSVRRALGDIDFHAGVYGEAPPDVTAREVIMVDFSYKRPVLEQMMEKCETLVIIDHHKTAQEDLAGFGNIRPGVKVIFDMDRSGAGLTWDCMMPGVPRPRLIDHIEDRDLWRFALPKTREIQAAVFSYPYDFKVWDELMAMPTPELAMEGIAIERKHHKDIAELVGVTKRRMKIGGHDVPVANLPYTLTSDAGNLMAEGEQFAACYWDTPTGRVFSLRSRPNGLDVSEIAKSYGGGGHKNASGFQRPRGWEGDQ